MSDRAMLAGMRIRVNPGIDAVLAGRLFARGRLPREEGSRDNRARRHAVQPPFHRVRWSIAIQHAPGVTPG